MRVNTAGGRVRVDCWGHLQWVRQSPSAEALAPEGRRTAVCYLTIRAGEGNVGKGLFTFYIGDGASTVMEQGVRSRAWGGGSLKQGSRERPPCR